MAIISILISEIAFKNSFQVQKRSYLRLNKFALLVISLRHLLYIQLFTASTQQKYLLKMLFGGQFKCKSDGLIQNHEVNAI